MKIANFRSWRRWAVVVLAWAGAMAATCAWAATELYTTLPTGPFSNADDSGSGGAPDQPVPGFVGPQGEGVSNYDADGDLIPGSNQTVNPAFGGWATTVVNYAPANPGLIDSTWLYPNSAGYGTAPLGPPTGNNFNVVSLGDLAATDIANGVAPGSITLAFNGSIVDGPGADFAVFGNAFILEGTNSIFCKLAYVEVSSDGVNFVSFPSEDTNAEPATEPQYGYPTEWPYAVFDPTLIYNLAGKHENAYGESWGTPFDLNQLANSPQVLSGVLDLNNVRYVRLVEIPGNGSYTDALGDPIYDAWLATGSPGFELQAVGVLNGAATVPTADEVTPSITEDPANVTLTSGQTAFLDAAASGEPPPSYHWQVLTAGSGTWSYLPDGGSYGGTTTANLVVRNATTGMSGEAFRCVAINAAGNATTLPATLTVNLALPQIYSQPEGQEGLPGESASFSVGSSGATGWQWQISTNGGISWSTLSESTSDQGTTGTSLTVNNLTVGMSGELFRCLVTNATGTVPSNAAELTVVSSVVFQTQPKSQVVKAGVTVIFAAKASGSGAVHYQWQFNGANITGATGANLTLKAVKAAATGNYTVVAATNTPGDSNSCNVSLQVVTAPVITIQPVAATVPPGYSVTLVTAASGYGLSYQWQIGTKDVTDNAEVAGAQTANLTFTDLSTSMTGSYRLVVSNLAGNTTSKAVKLDVALIPPKITTQPVAAMAKPDGSAMFTVAASGHELSYQWQFGTKDLADGAQVAGVGTASLTLSDVTSAMAGSYRVVVKNAAGSATSKAVKLTVK